MEESPEAQPPDGLIYCQRVVDCLATLIAERNTTEAE